MKTTSLQSTKAITLTALSAVTTACLLATAAHAASPSGQICATSRLPSTYVATSTKSVATLPFASPLNITPCASYTGRGTGEVSTVVDSKGTVFMAPVYSDQGLGVLRSKDSGATWDEVLPLRADGSSHVRIQPYMNIDPVTDRIFFHTGRSSIATLTLKTGFDLSFSDDGGDTWANAGIEVPAVDWGKLLPGAPIGGARTSG